MLQLTARSFSRRGMGERTHSKFVAPASVLTVTPQRGGGSRVSVIGQRPFYVAENAADIVAAMGGSTAVASAPAGDTAE